jgi:hypothetical protein
MFVHMLVYNKHLLTNIQGMNIKYPSNIYARVMH